MPNLDLTNINLPEFEKNIIEEYFKILLNERYEFAYDNELWRYEDGVRNFVKLLPDGKMLIFSIKIIFDNLYSSSCTINNYNFNDGESLKDYADSLLEQSEMQTLFTIAFKQKAKKIGEILITDFYGYSKSTINPLKEEYSKLGADNFNYNFELDYKNRIISVYRIGTTTKQRNSFNYEEQDFLTPEEIIQKLTIFSSDCN